MTNYVLDEETKKKLLGLMPLTQEGTIKFTPKCFEDLPEEVRPVFIQRALSRQEKSKITEIEENFLKSISGFVEQKDGAVAVSCKSQNDVSLFTIELRKKTDVEHELARKTVIGWEKVYSPATCKEIAFVADADKSADVDLFSGFCKEAKSELFKNALKISALTQEEKQGLKSLPESTRA